MKKVLVTGSSGYIGQHLVKILKDIYLLEGIDHISCNNIKLYLVDINGDLSKIDQYYDTVVHLAALVNVNESVIKPLEYYRTNIDGTLNILKNIRFNNFVFASTGTASQPNCPYALSKRVAEDIVETFCKENNKTFTTFRFYNVIGTDGFSPTNQDGLFYNLIKAEQTGIFKIFGEDYNTKDGTCVRDYVHVNEICFALKEAIDKPANKLENLGHGCGWTVKEIVDKYKQINKVDFKIESCSRRLGDLEKTVLDTVSTYMKKIYTFDELLKNDSKNL
jgi:UDP-glucose 4-epimerase